MRSAQAGAQHPARGVLERVRRREQGSRVEVALQRLAAHERSHAVERHAPIDAERLEGQLGERRVEVGSADGDVDARHAERCERLEHARGVRQPEGAVGGLVVQTSPGVEELDDLRARADLFAQVPDAHLGELLEQGMRGVGFGLQEGAEDVVLLAACALNGVRGERERRAAEADQRHARLATDQPDRVRHERRNLLGGRYAQRLDGGAASHRRRQHRPGAEVELQPHGGQRRHDVREQDGGVETVATDRLQRHLCRQFGRARQLPEGVLLLQRAVLGQMTARLPHDPDGRHRGVLPLHGAEEQAHGWSSPSGVKR